MIDAVAPKFSVRRACSVLGFRRSTYYRRKRGFRPEEVDAGIAYLLREAAEKYVAWGFWMIFHYLRKQGYKWNHKRVWRIWKAEGLSLRQKPQRQKIRREFIDLIAPGNVNQGWAMDFLSDFIIEPNGKPVRIINVIDECSRRALWTTAHESISASKLIDELDKLVQWRGAPEYIRCDNGPEFIADKLKQWAEKHHIELRHTQPGKPTQNGLVERLNKTLRAECLNLEWFQSMEILNEKIQEWSQTYNYIRPHSSLKYDTPIEREQKLKEKFYFRTVAA